MKNKQTKKKKNPKENICLFILSCCISLFAPLHTFACSSIEDLFLVKVNKISEISANLSDVMLSLFI